MRTITVAAGVLILVSLLAIRYLRPRPASGPAWPTDFSAALAHAKTQNKVVLADFTGGDWCGYCIQLREDVFDTPEFKNWVAESLVTVEIDFPQAKAQSPELVQQNQRLQQQFGVNGFPTVIFLNPAGQEIGRIVGYEGKSAWLAEARRIVDAR